MQMRDYLRAVLPAEGNGFYCASELLDIVGDNGKRLFRNRFFSALDELEIFISSADRGSASDIYLATNTFQSNTKRKSDNAHSSRAFFLDLDVGPEKPHATQKDAVQSIKDFCAASGFLFPYIISSGNGVYAVWPLSEHITSVVWGNVASLFKRVLDAYGVVPDPAITANNAGVLRPVGSHNKKNPSLWKPVQAIQSTVDGYTPPTPHQFVALLNEATKRRKINLGVTKKANSQASVYLEGISNPRPFSVNKAANACAQLSFVKAAQGNVAEPLWYATLGVAAFATEPDAIHEYSQGHPFYRREETEAKAEQWRANATGGTTCRKFHEVNPSLCESCSFFGKINSPIKLGYPDPEPIKHDQGFEPPQGFRRTEDGLQIKIDDQWVTFYPHDLYPVTVAYDDGLRTEVAIFKYKLPHEEAKDLVVETRVFADQRELHKTLLGAGISVLSQENLTRMRFYMGGYLERIRSTQKRDTLYATMGWKERDSSSPSFVIGEEAISHDGSFRHVGISRAAPDIVKSLGTKGDRQTTLNGFKTISKLYAQPNMEPLAFALLCEIGAPLMSFTGLSGATVSLVGDSGNGKTLTCKLGLSAYGDPYKMLMLAVDSEKFAQKRFGIYANLPVAIDEITNVQDQAISDLLYNITNGRDRGTLKRDRSDREGASWCTIGVVTTNQFLSSKLMFKANATAELNRLIELPVPRDTAITQSRGKTIDAFIRANHGHVGREFLRALMSRYDDLQGMVNSASQQVEQLLAARADERFAVATMAVAGVAGRILKDLGLIEFDVGRVLQWVADKVCTERHTRADMVSNPGDALARFASEYLGASIIMGYMEKQGGGALTVFHMNPSVNPSRIYLRYEYRFDKPEESTMLVNVPVFAEWVAKTMRMDIRQVKDWLVERGYFTGGARAGRQTRKSLGAQTAYKLPAVPTWTLRLQSIGTDLAMENVTSIAQKDPLFGDATREIRRRCAARKVQNPFDPTMILDATEVEA